MLMPGAVNCFADAGIVYAFWHSNLAGKAVILLLMLGSMFSWSVMVTKFVMIRRARVATASFLRRFRAARKPLAIYQSRDVYADSPAYHVYLAGCRELTFHLLGTTEIDDTFTQRVAEADPVSPVAMTAVRSALEREVGEQALRLEDRMTVLATAVSGAPFLGLLGTVWGVMDTFSGIAAAGTPNLTAMAPGVSGALITTVTGLLVAIPAMFGYNFLVVTLRGHHGGAGQFRRGTRLGLRASLSRPERLARAAVRGKMKRYSQRNGHTAMAELNVTPLLDLAFVLLIIFIITTPLLENNVPLQLPAGAEHNSGTVDPKSVRTVNIDRNGQVYLESQPMELPVLEQQLAAFAKITPEAAVVVRADKSLRYQVVMDAIDAVRAAKIDRLRLENTTQ